MFALYDILPEPYYPNPYEGECGFGSFTPYEEEREEECMDQDWLEEAEAWSE